MRHIIASPVTPKSLSLFVCCLITQQQTFGIMVRKPLRRLTLPEWHRVLDTNLTAAFLLARAAEKALRKVRGAIVTIASTRALMSEPNTESYSASKGVRCARSPTRSRSALPPTCASIASAPAASKPRIIPRYGARITSRYPRSLDLLDAIISCIVQVGSHA